MGLVEKIKGGKRVFLKKEGIIALYMEKMLKSV